MQTGLWKKMTTCWLTSRRLAAATVVALPVVLGYSPTATASAYGDLCRYNAQQWYLSQYTSCAKYWGSKQQQCDIQCQFKSNIQACLDQCSATYQNQVAICWQGYYAEYVSMYNSCPP